MPRGGAAAWLRIRGKHLDTLYRTSVHHITPNARTYVTSLYERAREVELPAVYDGDDVVVDIGRDGANARLSSKDGAVSIEVESRTEQGATLLRSFLGHFLEKVAAPEKPELVWDGFDADLDELPGLREMTLVDRKMVTPRMVRVRLAGRDLARFASSGHIVRLLFPPSGLAAPEWPKPGKNGRPVWPEEGKRPQSRVYTIRDVDVAAGTMDIDFVVHGAHGVAARWAVDAPIGDVIGVLGPTGLGLRQAEWYLLGGDETAIPAIARILAKIDPTALATVFIEIEDAAERQALTHSDNVTVHWLERNGLPVGRTTLLVDAMKSVTLPDDTTKVVWIGAELETVRDLRVYFKKDLGLDRLELNASGYWRFGKAESAPTE
jgi:NADPH-dependent ferric siderophore reductase